MKKINSVEVFDSRPCLLGEGPIWHPLREQFFWFDIYAKKLLSRSSQDGDYGGESLEWQFDDVVSAAGWTDREKLLVASETGLTSFNIDTGHIEHVVDVEPGNILTRTNDGRADPLGGFWISTMGKKAEIGVGSIYRYYRGELRMLHDRLTIPNSICFAPDASYVYFTDNGQKLIIYRQKLDGLGWPCEEPEIFVNLESGKHIADGSVVDVAGALWNAQWDSSRLVRYLPDGRFDFSVSLPARHCSCPAFGGRDMRTLLVTSARANLENPFSNDGLTFFIPDTPFQGIPEPKVEL